jgi:pimeloyl-ACP methyl ester carboxylesterase
VRVHGEAPTALVLLHGLPATGDTFGAAFDALDAQLVIPDLLGFGGSKLPADSDVTLAAHLTALDEAAAALGLQDKRLVVAGHSMGGLLAWAWAARHAAQVDAVVTWCAPLFDGPADARRALNAKVPGLGWIGVPGRLSKLVFTRLCGRYPTAAQRLYVLLYPRIPLALARRLTDYTWPAYVAAMNDIVRASDVRSRSARRSRPGARRRQARTGRQGTHGRHPSPRGPPAAAQRPDVVHRAAPPTPWPAPVQKHCAGQLSSSQLLGLHALVAPRHGDA